MQVLVAVRDLNRLERVVRTLRAALNVLSTVDRLPAVAQAEHARAVRYRAYHRREAGQRGHSLLRPLSQTGSDSQERLAGSGGADQEKLRRCGMQALQERGFRAVSKLDVYR